MHRRDVHAEPGRRPHRIRAGGALVALAALAAMLPGCAFRDHRDDLERLHATGRYDEAARVMDSQGAQDLYGEKNELLYLLDRGAVALALGDAPRTVELLNRAEQIMESQHGPTAGDEAARWTINDTAIPYYGEPYEDMYCNVLKLLAQLERGSVQGGATVEARRLSFKADYLRDKYLRMREQVVARGGAGFGQRLDAAKAEAGSARPLVSADTEGRFVESTLGTYLTAVTFMASGEREFQRVAGRRLLESIRVEAGLLGDVRPESFEGLGEVTPEGVNVLVVALSGRCPTKEPESFGPIPVFDWPVYFQIPVLRGGSAEAGSARFVVADAPGAPPPAVAPASPGPPAPATPGPGAAFPLSLVEDMRAVATENHRRELPLIYARAVLRSSLKAGAAFAASRATNKGSNDIGRLAVIIGGLAFVALTEQADLRCWLFLPGRAHVGLFRLTPGEHLVRAEYLGAGGGLLYATPWRWIVVPAPGVNGGPDGGGEADGAAGLVTVVEHYWR